MKISKSKLVWLIPACIGVIPLGVYLLPFLVQLLWSWIVPDLFPQATQTNLFVKEISWTTAAKVVLAILFVGVLLQATTMQHESKE